MADRIFLLSHHGYVLSRHNGILAQIPVAGLSSFNDLFDLESICMWNDGERFANFLSGQRQTSLTVFVPSFGEMLADFDPATGDIAFKKNNLFLCAEPNGAFTCNRSRRLAWESFIVVQEEGLRQLVTVLGSRWIVGSSRTVMTSNQICIVPGPSLLVGELHLPLKYNLPFDRSLFPYWFPIYSQGWRVDHLILFNPLLFFLAKGRSTIDQLLVSIDSLAIIGKFDGSVLIYSDAPISDLPFYPKLNIVYKEHPSTDWVGFVAGKYSILEESALYEHAPVAYFDPDIIFNAPIEPLLIDMVCARRPTAPLEHFSKMQTSPSVGAELLRENNVRLNVASGFNAGTFAVPNLREFGHVFRTIRSVIVNYLELNGREALRWVDQEAANYVGYLHGGIDTYEVTKYVRYGWYDDAYRLGSLCGLVHFCGIHRENRLEPMKSYLRLVREHYGY